MDENHMNLCDESCSSGRSDGRPSCVAINLTLGITHKQFNQFIFLPAMLIRTIAFYHYVPLSLTLTLPGGHKVSAKQNVLASVFRALFI